MFVGKVDAVVTPLTYNFDIEMDWSIVADVDGILMPVTDQATFEQWLEYGSDPLGTEINNLTNIVITDFVMSGNHIQCNLTADGTIINFANNNLVNADKIGIINGLQYIGLSDNQLVSYNPNKALPGTLTTLDLGNNLLPYFNPTFDLPSDLTSLNLRSNQMNLSGYTIMEQWANSQPVFTNTCNVNFSDNLDMVGGTNLYTILNSKNCSLIV